MSANDTAARVRPTPHHAADATPKSDAPRLLIASRVIPVFAMLVLFVMSVAIIELMPAGVLRAWLCPVHHPQAIQDACARHEVDPMLACAVIECESNWEEDAASGAGAVGLMQLMPSTAEYLANIEDVDGDAYPYDQLADPRVNIEYGVALLGRLDRSLDSRDAVIAAYNAGLGQASSWAARSGEFKDAIDFPETAAYLTRVNQYYDFYKRLYPNGIA